MLNFICWLMLEGHRDIVRSRHHETDVFLELDDRQLASLFASRKMPDVATSLRVMIFCTIGDLSQGPRAQVHADLHKLTRDTSAPDIMIATDQAITLGLLANELVTNAFKYAYGGEDGPVRLSIEQNAGDRLRFSVSDEGQGMPEGFDAAGQSLGIRLIRSLSRQLGGTPKWKPGNPGTVFELEFEPMDLSNGSPGA